MCGSVNADGAAEILPATDARGALDDQWGESVEKGITDVSVVDDDQRHQRMLQDNVPPIPEDDLVLAERKGNSPQHRPLHQVG